MLTLLDLFIWLTPRWLRATLVWVLLLWAVLALIEFAVRFTY